MRAIFQSLLLSFLFSCIAGSANAQIRDDESSQAVLAVQCAVSSGFSASDFEDYSRRLAKTLSLLTSSQQKKVFGYLPQPSGFSANDWKDNSPSGSDQTSTAVYAGESESPGSSVSGIANGNTPQNIEEAAEAIAGSRTNKSWDAIVTWLTALAEKAGLK